MTKATDLPPLVARLLKLKESAVTPTDACMKEVAAQMQVLKIGDLQVWYFDSTLPPEATFPAPPIPCLGIEVRQGSRMDLLLRIHVEDGQIESGKLKANTWKRGTWEQMLPRPKLESYARVITLSRDTVISDDLGSFAEGAANV